MAAPSSSLAKAALLLCLAVALAPSLGRAQTFPVTQCAADRFRSDLGCTAGDVSITGIKLAPGGPTSCVGGTSVTADLDITVNFSTPDRWDIGIFLVNDGKPPMAMSSNGGAAVCSVGVLPTTAPFLDLDGASIGIPADTCGDGNGRINGNTGSGVFRMTGVPVRCQAINLSGGNLYIPFVVSWDNQSSPSGSTCRSNADPVPNTKSKCNSPNTTVATEVAYGTVPVVVLPQITKTNNTPNATMGGTSVYTVVITNTTGVSLSGASFADPAITGLNVTGVSCAAGGGATCPAGLTVAGVQGAGVTLATMPVNSTLTFTLTGTVTAAAGATLTNTASVSVAGQSNTASDTDQVLPRITVRAQTTGGTAAFNYTGTNGVGTFSLNTATANPQTSTTFNATALNTATTITQTPPALWTVGSASCTDGSSSFGSLSGNVLTLAASDLTAGRNIVCTFNNRPLGADLAVTAAVNTPVPTAGNTVTFTLTVTNLGPDPTTGAVLTGASLPAGYTLLSSTASQGTYSAGTWTIGALPVGGTVTLTITARVNDRDVAPAASAYSFTTTASSNLADTVTANNSATASVTPPVPRLSFVKVADRTTARPGDVITYTITVTNTGTGSARSVIMLDPLDEYVAMGLNAYGTNVAFSSTDSTPASGLTMPAPAYSNSSTTWTAYTATSGGGGAPAGYDNNVRQWRLPMNGTLRPGGSLTVRFQTRIK
ncbi:DUF11 domain-containing protein [Aggregicoccus sp. 17bor-14]|uniref:prealbumin-like fold domain-containing protein n=1 Tax=Myxococcaceae TaxID=31 RepID=UPI00129C5000|nr:MULTISPECIES: DUF11 domain-containing protein [Myxococcaceae]MBF5041545.1 DUF11 domain-containing protein [Simulacricoccus sp. 17bor-14]MRI87330.1 DUF11 domain-containing protein [Aggregicoccus sp. 17bor-14]